MVKRAPIVYELVRSIEEDAADLEWSANLPQRAEYKNRNGKTRGTLWERVRDAADALERALGADPESTYARRSDHDISDRARAFGRVNILASGIIRAGVLQPVRTKRPY